MSDLKSAFDLNYVKRLAAGLGAGNDFIDALWPTLESLEMKARTIALADAVHGFYESSFAKSSVAIDVLFSSGDWTGFDAWPLICVAERHGLDSPAESLKFLRKWTHLYTAEFAIRPYLHQDFDAVFAQLHEWSSDEDEHVRRLVSEGTRPRLPWGQNVKAIEENLEAILELIAPLRLDSSAYVRRSVSNHLNDWTKLHPAKVKALLDNWGDSAEEYWVKTRALRTLVKAGDADALRILGFNGEVTLEDFACSEQVLFPGHVEFAATLSNSTSADIRIVLDFAIEHQGSNGLRAPKVFKWKNLKLGSGETVTLKKRHAFKPINTRKYYDGVHHWILNANGSELARVDFNLHGVH